MRIRSTRFGFEALFVSVCILASSPASSSSLDSSLTKQTSTIASIPLGHGIIAPYKIAIRPNTQGSELLLITGEGESFGTSTLHLLHSQDLKEIRHSLSLCGNASGIVVPSNEFAVVACRGSQELVVVDLTSWEVSAHLNLNFSPIAMAVIAEHEVAISSVSTGSICIISIGKNWAHSLRCENLKFASYALVADPRRHVIYETVPDFGIIELDDQTLDVRKKISIKGVASFGAVLLRSDLIFTDRDGYLWAIDADARVQKVDLAIMLGIDRNTMPLRGIDPTDIVSLGDDHIAVLSGRTNSVVLTIERTAEGLKFSRFTQLPSAIYGVFDQQKSVLFMTIPTDNKIIRTDVPPFIDETSEWKTQTTIVGNLITYAINGNSDRGDVIALIDSDNNLMFVTYANEKLQPHPVAIKGFVPIGPLAFRSDSSLLVVGNWRGAYSLAQISMRGELLRIFPLDNLRTIFSFSVHDDQVLLVNRLRSKFAILDLASGKLTTYDSIRTRPRAGLLLGNGRMILIHDTNPDNGYSLWQDLKFIRFVSTSELGGYPTDIVRTDGQDAAISFFDGKLITVNLENNNVLHDTSVADQHLWSLTNCSKRAIWANAPDFSASDIFVSNGEAFHIQARINISDLSYIYPFSHDPCFPISGRKLWAVTSTGISVIRVVGH